MKSQFPPILLKYKSNDGHLSINAFLGEDIDFLDTFVSKFNKLCHHSFTLLRKQKKLNKLYTIIKFSN